MPFNRYRMGETLEQALAALQPVSATVQITVGSTTNTGTHVDVSLVGTPLEGMFAANDPVLVNPQSDIGGGLNRAGIVGCRISATDVLRVTTFGSAAGTFDLTVTKIPHFPAG